MNARVLVVVSLCALVPATAMPQALTSLASVRVGYNTRKNTVKPTGELKAQIDDLDAQIAEATRLGRNAELRRLMAKGITLLAGRDRGPTFSTTRARSSCAPTTSSRTRPKPYPSASNRFTAPSIELQRTA